MDKRIGSWFKLLRKKRPFNYAELVKLVQPLCLQRLLKRVRKAREDWLFYGYGGKNQIWKKIGIPINRTVVECQSVPRLKKRDLKALVL